MPVWYMREPLCALIFCGMDGSDDAVSPHGLKLAVMARPSFFKEKRVKLTPLAKRILDTLQGGGRTVAEMAEILVEVKDKRRKARDHVGSACNVLLSFLFVGKRGSVWHITPAGQARLKAEDK